MIQTNKVQIPDRLFFRIGDVSELLDVKPHVLRYWESEFSVVTPSKSNSGQRVYRRSDVETLVMIKRLLHEERYSIEGARRRIRELRKEGELKAFKQNALTPRERDAFLEAIRAVETKQAEPLKEKIEALVDLAVKPLSDLFQY